MNKINNKNPYIRIGTSYFKIVEIPLMSGDFLITLIPWIRQCIIDDHGKDYLYKIPKYDGFCNVPNHLNFRQVVGNFYNLYMPFEHTAVPGSWPNIEMYLKHLFGEQFELGLDYLKLLIENPCQKLPILCFVSKERNTGKSTFFAFLKALFSNNVTINTNEDFKSRFNSEWISKLLICVDEALLETRSDSERLKNLSTAKFFKAESKGKDRIECEFYGKFVLNANNEDGFIIIEPGETRYWVIKVPPFKNDIVKLIDRLQEEIPHFLEFILNRPLSTKCESRMHFNPKLLQTPALLKVMRRNRNRTELEILNIFQIIFDYSEIDSLSFCLHDIQDMLRNRGLKVIETAQIKRIVQNEWKLTPVGNSLSYQRYKVLFNGSVDSDNSAKGRYYTITKEQLTNLNE
jgi:hypothetical protein